MEMFLQVWSEPERLEGELFYSPKGLNTYL